MKRLRVIIPVIVILALGALFYTRLNPESNYTNTQNIDVDWVIDDYQVREDTMLNIKGSIIIEGEGHLVLRNCYLNFQQDYNNQYKMQVGSWEAEDIQRVDFTDVIIDTSGKWMYFEFLGNTEASYTGVKCSQLNLPWHLVAKNSKLTAKDTNIGVTFADNATMTAEDSDLFIEMVLRNCSGEYALPLGEVDELAYEFDMGSSVMSFETTGCSFREWGVTLDHSTDIRFVDTKITIGLNAGSGPEGVSEPIVVSGLKAKKYDYLELVFDSNIVELVNCDIVSWYPQAFNGAVIDISESYLADVQWNGADSTVIVRDSTAYMAYGRENVTYVFYDSEITGEVTATDNSKIYLINTQVQGKTTEKDNGMVFLDEEPVWETGWEVKESEYNTTKVITGDWIIEDYQEITDTFVTLDGSIYVRGEGKLVIRDSYLNVTMDYNNEHQIAVGEPFSNDSPSLEMYNVVYDTEGIWMPVRFHGHSVVVYDNVQTRYQNMPWHNGEASVEITAINSELGLTIGENATLEAKDSLLFLEIMFSEINGTYSLPIGEVEKQDFSFKNGKNEVNIVTNGCSFYEWGTTLDKYTNVTFVDTVMTIGMNAGLGSAAPEDPIVLANLKSGYYDYFEVDYDTNHLTLIDTEVVEWYPQVFGGTVLEISDSNLADLQWNGGDSVIIARNCTMSIATAMQEVNYFIYDSEISGDVTATADSKIYLFSTEVQGRIMELDNGQVFIDDEPYED